MAIGAGPGAVEVLADLEDLRAERAHPLDLASVRVARDVHDGRQAERASRIGDALAEVAGGGHDDRPFRADPARFGERVDGQPRAPALERADRVVRLDLRR